MSGATAWDDPASRETHALTVNEALHCGTKLDHSPITRKPQEIIQPHGGDYAKMIDIGLSRIGAAGNAM